MRITVSLSAILIVCFASLGATWVLPGKGAHGGTPVVSFVEAELQHLGAASDTTVTPGATIDVQAGDLVVFLFGGAQASSQNYTASSSPSVGTFTELFDAFDSVRTYQQAFYAVVATSSQTGVTVTGSFGVSTEFRFAMVAVFRTTNGTFSIGQSTRNTGAPQATGSTTDRTAENLTTTVANTLLVTMGTDVNGSVTHTAANGYTLSADGLVSFLYWKQISATGSHPGGNFGTVNSADNYWSFFLEASIN